MSAQTAAVIQAWSTVVLVFITGVYAYLTHGMSRAVVRQNFEGMFLELRRSHLARVSNIRVILEGREFQGPAAFEKAVGVVVGLVLNDGVSPEDVEQSQGSVDQAFRSTCIAAGSDFGNYLRGLFALLKFVDDANLDEQEKYSYVALLRADLSNAELGLVLLNCVSPLGAGRYRALIEKYSLLSGMIYSHDLLRQLALAFFDRSAITRGAGVSGSKP